MNSDSPSPLRIFVRRGALWRFNRLVTRTAGLAVEVLWDRRAGERRERPTDVPRDSRRRERRGALPVTWGLADFVVAPAPDSDGPDVPARGETEGYKSEIENRLGSGNRGDVIPVKH